jgi:hypothetical protein
MTTLARTRFVVIVCLLALGCARKPVTAPRAVVPEPGPSGLRAAATAAQPFGDMVVLGVGVSNGSRKDYAIAAERVFAVDGDGNRIAPLSVAEAARQAGGTTALVAGLRGAGTGGLLAAVVGAIPGAVIGAAQNGGHGAGTGAAVGAGIGAAVGAVGGFFSTKSETEAQIVEQLGGLYLGEKNAKPGIPVSGFVFFPEGRYAGVQVIAVERPNGTVEEVYGPMVQPATN